MVDGCFDKRVFQLSKNHVESETKALKLYDLQNWNYFGGAKVSPFHTCQSKQPQPSAFSIAKCLHTHLYATALSQFCFCCPLRTYVHQLHINSNLPSSFSFFLMDFFNFK